MISKQKISLIKSLHIKKYAYEHKLFIIEGEKLLNEALNTKPDLIKEVYILNELYADWEQGLTKAKAIVHVTNSKQLEQISNLSTPAGIVALCNHFDNVPDVNSLKSTVSIYLHELRDPGNLGTIIRCADWFGIKNILCSKGSVDLYNTKVIQATMGSIFRTNVAYIEEEMLTQIAKVIPLYATSMTGDNLYSQPKIVNGLIMFGSESHGLPERLINFAVKNISIPKSKDSNAESLNVAVAAGIVFSHILT